MNLGRLSSSWAKSYEGSECSRGVKVFRIGYSFPQLGQWNICSTYCYSLEDVNAFIKQYSLLEYEVFLGYGFEDSWSLIMSVGEINPTKIPEKTLR